MKNAIRIQGYKCPYCGYENTNEMSMQKHIQQCTKNDEYVQKCINCTYLEEDWLTRKLYDGKSICCYTKANCPYVNHDDAEIRIQLEMHREDMKKYGY